MGSVQHRKLEIIFEKSHLFPALVNFPRVHKPPVNWYSKYTIEFLVVVRLGYRFEKILQMVVVCKCVKHPSEYTISGKVYEPS